MSTTLDNAAKVLRYQLNDGIPLMMPWDDLSEEAKNSYRRLVWSVLHAMFNDMSSVSVYPKDDIVFEQDASIMLYTAMATPKNSQLGIMNQEGRTMAEAIVTAVESATHLPRVRNGR